MNKIKILIIFGTRPEIIKLIPVIKEIQKNKNKYNLHLCTTGQHSVLKNNIIKFFNLKVDTNFNLMKNNQSLSDLNSIMIKKINDLISAYKPDYGIVHGDTSTTFCSSLVFFYNKIKFFHVEAGLRTFDLFSPFPEEFNRQITSKLAYKHFAPTRENKVNLIKENIKANSIIVTGNTSIDTIKLVMENIEKSKTIKNNIINYLQKNLKVNFLKDQIILVTIHRRENFGNPLKEIFKSLKYLALKHKNIKFIYPVHPNPNVSLLANKNLNGFKNIILSKPLDYHIFIFLLNISYLVISDSGGIQEEAPFLGKPVILLRNKTERPEVKKTGNTLIAGSNFNKIIKLVNKLIFNDNFYKKSSKTSNIYGNGDASKIIIKNLK